jgi:hypothetical protein
LRVDPTQEKNTVEILVVKNRLVLLIIALIFSNSAFADSNQIPEHLTLKGMVPVGMTLSGIASLHTTNPSCNRFNLDAMTRIPQQKSVQGVVTQTQNDKYSTYSIRFDIASNSGGKCGWQLESKINSIELNLNYNGKLGFIWIEYGGWINGHVALSAGRGETCSTDDRGMLDCSVVGADNAPRYLDTSDAVMDISVPN